MRRKRKNLQKKFRNTTFGFHQYWHIQYIEYYKDGSYKGFITIIKAKSLDLAKLILKQKVNEDNEGTKVKFHRLNMFHDKYVSKRLGKLDVSKWENIRNASFPNISNILFKKHMPCIDECVKKNKANFKIQKEFKNSSNKLGFKKGKLNWSTLHRSKEALPEDQRKGKVWNGGRWVEWNPDDMEKTKNSIINALIVNNNVRTKAAKYLKMNRGHLAKIMSRIPNIDWNKEYPISKPFENFRKKLELDKK